MVLITTINQQSHKKQFICRKNKQSQIQQHMCLSAAATFLHKTELEIEVEVKMEVEVDIEVKP